MADGALNYEFKVDVHAEGLKEAAHEVDNVHHKLDKLDKKHGEVHGHAKHHFGGVGHAVEGAEKNVHHLLEALGLILVFEIGEKIVHGLHHIAHEALHAAGAAERMDLSFKLALGEHEGHEMVEFLERISGKTEFTDDKLKSWGKQLINAGVAAEELDKFMAAALDVAARSPDKMEGMSNAIAALTRAELTGTIGMKQLRGLSIGIEQLKELPKFAGMSVKQLKKELEEGHLTKEDLLSVIAGPDKILGDLGLQAGKTLEARMLHLKAIPEEIFQRLRNTAVFDKLSTAIGKMVEKLNPEGPFGDKILKFVEKVTDEFTHFIEDVDIESAIDVLLVGLDGAVRALKAIASLVEFVMDEVQMGIIAFGSKEDAERTKVALGRRVAKRNLDEATERGKEQMATTEAQKDLEDLDDAIREGLLGPEKQKQLMEQGKKAGHGLAHGMASVHEDVKHGGEELGGKAIEGASHKLETHSPSRVFEDIGKDVAMGFAIGVRGGSDESADALDSLMRGQPSVAASGGGGFSVSVGPVEVNVVAGGDGEAAGRDAARAFAAQLRPELINILEMVRTQMGAG